jgi:ATP-dependent RNA helicase DDX10/DBP4
MMKILNEGNIPIKKLSVNPNKAVSVSKRAASIVASNPETNRLAKKAFQSYLRSVYLMPNKDIFKVSELPYDEYAISLGLASTPSTRFLKSISDRDNIRESKNTSRKLQRLKEQIKAEKLQKRVEKYGEEARAQKKQQAGEDSDNDDDVLVVKKRHNWEQDEEVESDLPDIDINRATSRSNKRIRLESSHGLNKRIVFDDDGEEQDAIEQTISTTAEEIGDLAGANKEYLERVQKRLASNKSIDDAEAKARIKEKHRKQRMEKKASTQRIRDDDNEGGAAVLLQDSYTSSDDDSESVESSGNDSSSSSDSDDSDDMSVGAQESLALELLRKR